MVVIQVITAQSGAQPQFIVSGAVHYDINQGELGKHSSQYHNHQYCDDGLFVWLSLSPHISETASQNFRAIFLRALPVAVARSRSGSAVIRYVLPVS